MSENQFINGLIVKEPHERAPDYVKAKLSIKRQELIDWLSQQQGEWINADVKVSQHGKWYAAVDDWKPDSQRGGGHGGRRGGQEQRQRPAPATESRPVDDFADVDIPFVTQFGNS